MFFGIDSGIIFLSTNLVQKEFEMWYQIRAGVRKKFLVLSIVFFLAAVGLLLQGDGFLGATLLLAGTAVFYPAARVQVDLMHERRLRIK